MAKNAMIEIPAETLRQVLDYNQETGKLFWKHRPREFFKTEGNFIAWNKRFSGKEAFTAKRPDGYPVGAVFHTLYRAHRVIYALHHGEWPSDEIDHINHIRDDNRISNLRIVNRKIQLQNTSRRITNTSGVNGIYWNKRNKRWNVRIGSKNSWVGAFESLDAAIVARKSAEKEHGYHPNHGCLP